MPNICNILAGVNPARKNPSVDYLSLKHELPYGGQLIDQS